MTTITFNQEEYYALRDLIEHKLDKLCDMIRKDDNNLGLLTEHEKDIRNYTTYDLFMKITGAPNYVH